MQRPRDVPVRISLGVAFYMVLLISSANDGFAYFFDISMNATTWMGRIGLLVLPPAAYWVLTPDVDSPGRERLSRS